MEDDKLYVKHILEATNKIEQFVSGFGLEKFSKDEKTQSAAIREIGIIGEAAKKLSDMFKNSRKDIPWKKIVGMRDKLVHDYFEIDLGAVWKTIKEDLPDLKQKLSK